MDIPVQVNKGLQQRLKWAALAALGVAAVGGLSALFWLDDALPSIEQDQLWVAEVQQGDLNREVRGVGVLSPAEVNWVSAQTNGKVERLLIKPGAVVTPGTVLMELSNPDLHRQLQQAQWDLTAAEANLLALQAELEEQRLEQQRLLTEAQMALESAQMLELAQQPLAEKSIISHLDFATTKLRTRQAQALLSIREQSQQHRSDVIAAKLGAERAIVRKFQNLHANIQAQVDELTVTAGSSGVLQELSIERGQQVQQGENLAVVAQPQSLIAELQVAEAQAKDIRLGQPVTIDTRNAKVQGRIVRVDPRVLQGNVQVDVEMLDALPEGARPDLSITGTILVEQLANVVYVDRPAGVGAETQANLFVLDRQNKVATRQSIGLGKASVSEIVVLNGLYPGDKVVVSDTSAIQNFDAVRIIQ